MDQIVGYRRLLTDVESVRRTLYSSENPEHESQLLEVCSGFRVILIWLCYAYCLY